MKAKGPAAAKAEEEKKKGLALFGPKPPTPKLLRAVGGTINRKIIDKLTVITLFSLNIKHRQYVWSYKEVIAAAAWTAL